MKLLFSESRPDHGHYVYPFAIWAFPEEGETPADLLAAGFLPSGHKLDRYYLCRHTRVVLKQFAATSENRRVLRKWPGVQCEAVSREDFALSEERLAFCLSYTRSRFSGGGMSEARLRSLFASPVTTHVLIFRRESDGRELGYVTCYREAGRALFYYYAFYSIEHVGQSLGAFMMTTAAQWCAREGIEYLYLGTCYSESALYKTQFAGFEFFNGMRWSNSRDELKALLGRGGGDAGDGHLLEDEGFRARHLPEGLGAAAAASRFRG
ncbi:GNAT family N-acetyltransferase [Oleiharenicola sp. Vm1]|uniref:GNAT family N-acetyltransferase n=1 Tax=Oleiharenicola sp. Vm1 TaxID=3398393 RepID=UPI0039F61809